MGISSLASSDAYDRVPSHKHFNDPLARRLRLGQSCDLICNFSEVATKRLTSKCSYLPRAIETCGFSCIIYSAIFQSIQCTRFNFLPRNLWRWVMVCYSKARYVGPYIVFQNIQSVFIALRNFNTFSHVWFLYAVSLLVVRLWCEGWETIHGWE